MMIYLEYTEILSAAVSNVVSALVKWLWSLKSNTKMGIGPSLSSHFSVVPRFCCSS
jgi:hypothetical protein